MEMVKPTLAYPLIFLFLTLTGCADEETEDKVLKHSNSTLWRIEGNGLSEPSYLFGTIHMVPSKYFEFPDQLKETVAKCNRLIVEVPMHELVKVNPMSAKRIEHYNWMQALSEADQRKISKALHNRLGDILGSFGDLGIMKPFWTLTLLILPQDLEDIRSFEMELERTAAENDIPVSGLETAEYQVSLFDSFEDDDVTKWILLTIDHLDEVDRRMENMYQDYYEQNLENLITQWDLFSSEGEEFLEMLLYQRNRNWIPKIEELINEERCFIAVGAGHLPGKGGVIELLEEQGYELTPLSTK